MCDADTQQVHKPGDGICGQAASPQAACRARRHASRGPRCRQAEPGTRACVDDRAPTAGRDRLYRRTRYAVNETAV
jgi:hypothetical protein